MIKRIAFTMYSVRDMARARRFYEGELGLPVSENYENVWVEYAIEGGVFAITSMVEKVRPAADAGGVIAFEVDDVDALTQQLRGAGAKVLSEPFSTPVCRMSIVADPDGNAVTLHRVTD